MMYHNPRRDTIFAFKWDFNFREHEISFYEWKFCDIHLHMWYEFINVSYVLYVAIDKTYFSRWVFNFFKHVLTYLWKAFQNYKNGIAVYEVDIHYSLHIYNFIEGGWI